MRRIVAVGTLSGCISLAVAALAFGHVFSAPSQVAIDQSSNRVAKGHVASRHVSCTRNRRVEVRAVGTRRLYGFDRTDEQGEWRVDADYATAYFAKVRTRVFERGGHLHICRGDHSARAG